MRVPGAIVAATVAAMTAGFPAVAQQAPTAAPSQQGQISDAMVHKVGTALRQVAMIRQQYSQRAQSTSSEQQQTLSDQAKRDMLKAVNDQGLSVEQYDHTIQMAQNDETLKHRLLTVARSGN